MTGASKITLSAEELQLAGNAQWILTKHSIINKAVILLGNTAAKMQGHVAVMHKRLPEELSNSTPKIAKGENYLQLPYVILDYPRSFIRDNVFAIRTMFWWGNFISITLHVSGIYKKILEQALQKDTVIAHLNNFYLCINESEWQHHFAPDNYLPLNKFTAGEIQNSITKRHFIKVAAKYDLQQWNNMEGLLEKEFLKLMQLVIP